MHQVLTSASTVPVSTGIFSPLRGGELRKGHSDRVDLKKEEFKPCDARTKEDLVAADPNFPTLILEEMFAKILVARPP